MKADDQELYVTVRGIRRAIELADLHDRQARERRRQERERTIEELAATARPIAGEPLTSGR
jgi:hypothetical protein